MNEIKLRSPSFVLVFGSNTRGIHGAGSALAARKYFGAILYKGRGLHGRSFAIPTKDDRIKTLPITKIIPEITAFIKHANDNPEKIYLITRVGCGLAGLKDADISIHFKDAPANCLIPVLWNDLNGNPIQNFILVNDIGMDDSDFDILRSNYKISCPSTGFKP